MEEVLGNFLTPNIASPVLCFKVTFDLDLDLEHTLDAGYTGDHHHHVQIWWRSNQPFACENKRFS